METRAAKRRAEAVNLVQNQSPKRKRVVLGELPNLTNLIDPVNSNPGLEKPKYRRNTRAKKDAAKKDSLSLGDPKLDEREIKAKKALEVDAKSSTDANLDDLQNSEPYVSDIYQYLRNMEVILGLLVGFIFVSGSEFIAFYTENESLRINND